MRLQPLQSLFGRARANRPDRAPVHAQAAPAAIIRLGAPPVRSLPAARLPVASDVAVSPACEGEGFARAMALAHLDALRDLGQPAYEMFARVAAQVCGAPMAAITLLDDTTQWIQGSVGVPFKYTPIELSFCRHALGSGGALTVIADTRDDARVALHPLVTGAPGVRFYAGAPLVQPNGQVIGTVCVTDVRPRQLTPAQAQSLRWLAGAAMRMLQLRAPTAAESHLLAPRLAA